MRVFLVAILAACGGSSQVANVGCIASFSGSSAQPPCALQAGLDASGRGFVASDSRVVRVDFDFAAHITTPGPLSTKTYSSSDPGVHGSLDCAMPDAGTLTVTF